MPIHHTHTYKPEPERETDNTQYAPGTRAYSPPAITFYPYSLSYLDGHRDPIHQWLVNAQPRS